MSETIAVATMPFKGAPDGSAYPEQFEIGDPVEGDLADVAIAEGWAALPTEAPAKATKPAKAAK